MNRVQSLFMAGKNEEMTTELSQVRLWGLTGENEMERQGWRIHLVWSFE